MKASLETVVVGERLPPLLAEARRRARRLGGPVLASLTMRADATHELALAGRSGSFLWEQAERRFSLAALGEAVRLTAAGPARFEALRGRLSRLLADAVVEQETGEGLVQPLCLGGFAFGSGRDPAAPEWRDFPEALVVVPRILVTGHGEERSLTLNALVSPTEDVTATAAALRMEVTRASVASGEGAEANHGTPLGPPPALGHDEWCRDVADLAARIEAGEAEKVVLARRVTVESEAPFNIAAVLQQLRERYRECTIFAVRDGDASFLGATPEMLVRLEGRQVRADCLAGSAARGADGAEDDALGRGLLADEKERREHAMVVNAIAASLREVCGGLDAADTPALRRMANLQHLHTPISATAAGDIHILELVERLHPTPAVGGVPQGRALCLLQEHERFNRGWYAGPIGWMAADGSGEFVVALRSALVRDRSAYLYAGCGIVSGSDPEREYEESQLKLQAMLWALNGAS